MTFWRGFFSIFNIWPSTIADYPKIDCSVAASWRAVGNDLRKAMGIAPEHDEDGQ